MKNDSSHVDSSAFAASEVDQGDGGRLVAVSFDEVFDDLARETLRQAASELGCRLWLLDARGQTLLGEPLPLGTDDLQRVEAGGAVDRQGERYSIYPITFAEGTVGWAAIGPLPDSTAAARALAPEHIANHLGRLVSAFAQTGLRRAQSTRVHLAAVEEANRELTEKNQRLGQAVERLEEADRMKSNFLATVSHELRTPLTSVIGYSEMLLEGIAGALNEEQTDYVRTVMEKGEQLLQLITGILDISRMEAGEMHFVREPFEVGEVVAVVLSTVMPHARRKKIDLRSSIAADLPPFIGDRDKLRQVVLNLVSNSLKFTEEGGAIEVAAERSAVGPRALRLTVRDTGIGISIEQQRRIFDPFYQVDNSSTREYGGTGLGLSIVKRFVEGMGGTVRVDSELGRGATFVVILPFGDS